MLLKFYYVAVVVMSLMACAAWGQGQVKVVTLENKTYHGTISKIQKKPQLMIVVQTAQEEKSIPALDIVEIVCQEYGKSPADAPCFFLHDGSRLFATIEDGSANQVSLRTLSFGLLPLEIGKIREIRFAPELGDVVANNEQDVIYFKKQEKNGQPQGGDTMNCVVEQFAKQHVLIQHPQLGARKEPYEKIERITLAQLETPDTSGSQPSTILMGVDGSKLVGEIVEIQNHTVVFQVPYLQRRLNVDMQLAQRFFFINGRFAYVSDLPPTQCQINMVPYFEGASREPFMAKMDQCWYRPQSTQTCLPIRLQGQLFYKGLGVISRSEIKISVDGKYRRFQSQIGIDDCVRESFEQDASALRIGGSVIFQVMVDGVKKFDSGVVRWCDPPQTVDIEITGKKSLLLIVDWADQDSPGYGKDYANWAGARLIK